MAPAYPKDAVSAGTVVQVSGADSTVRLVPRTVLLDPTGTLSPTEALRKLDGPEAIEETAVYSHGYIPDVLWSRIVLEVEPDAAGDWYLTLELPNFDRLQVFDVTASGEPVPLTELGDRVPETTDIQTRFHIAALDLPPGRSQFLVRGRTSSTMTLDLNLRKIDRLLDEEQDFFALQSFYLGIATVFTFAALGLFAYTRQTIYLVYMFNLIAHSGVWLLINGTGPGHLWPELAHSWHVDPHIFVAMTIAGTAAFAAMFLSTARIPRIIRIIIWSIAAAGIGLMALCAVVPQESMYWANNLTSVIVLPVAGLLLVVTAFGLFRGEPAARPLMLTWVGLIGAVVIAWIRDLGIVPSNAFTLAGPQIGSVFEMIVFAFMLLQRLGRIQSEKEEIQRAALDAARQQEAVLEQRVADRTAELTAAMGREREARRLQQQFVSMVSHEFRNPLAIIDSAAQNFSPGHAADQGRLEKIRAAVRRLRGMIDTCLIDERIRGGEMHLQRERLEICELIEDAADMLRAAGDGIRFEMELPDGPVMTNADARMIEIALSNVLDNAVKYSPAGAPIRVSVVATAREIEIGVADRGPGIPEAERERIFERHYRAGQSTRNSDGAGLGLFLVRSILAAHGGTIECTEAPGGGALFFLRLPAAPATAGAGT